MDSFNKKRPFFVETLKFYYTNFRGKKLGAGFRPSEIPILVPPQGNGKSRPKRRKSTSMPKLQKNNNFSNPATTPLDTLPLKLLHISDPACFGPGSFSSFQTLDFLVWEVFGRFETLGFLLYELLVDEIHCTTAG